MPSIIGEAVGDALAELNRREVGPGRRIEKAPLLEIAPPDGLRAIADRATQLKLKKKLSRVKIMTKLIKVLKGSHMHNS
jgi:hypothetical protein